MQVIPRKDLPRIYTMCLPVKDRDGRSADPAEGEGELSLSSGLQDLEVRFPVFFTSFSWLVLGCIYIAEIGTRRSCIRFSVCVKVNCPILRPKLGTLLGSCSFRFFLEKTAWLPRRSLEDLD